MLYMDEDLFHEKSQDFIILRIIKISRRKVAFFKIGPQKLTHFSKMTKSFLSNPWFDTCTTNW